MTARIVTLNLLAAIVAAAPSVPERLIAAGHWKQARVIVESRLLENPRDALATYLLSQIRHAFGDRDSPLPLAEKAVALDDAIGKYHRQLAEALGVKAQHSGLFVQLLLAWRFKKEIDTAITLDPHDLQALRDLMEFYLLAPGVAGGDKRKAQATAEAIARIDPCTGFSAQARLAEFRAERNKVEDFLRKAVESDPRDYRARIALAEYDLVPAHANPEAVEWQAKAATEIDPGQAAAYVILAGLYARRSQWVELEAMLATAEKEVPDDLTPYYRAAGELLDANRSTDRAIRYLQRYLGIEPEGNEPARVDAQRKLTLVGAGR